MKDFDALKQLWLQEPSHSRQVPGPFRLSGRSKDARSRLIRQQWVACLILAFTGFAILYIGFFSGIPFRRFSTHIGLVLAILVVWLQAVLLFDTYRKLKRIDDTLPPTDHLAQWQSFYENRQRQIRWNKPLYFLMLNLALGLYFIEIMSGRPALNILLTIGAYFTWMLFAYFVLGRKALQKERTRLQQIIKELSELSSQFNPQESSGAAEQP